MLGQPMSMLIPQVIGFQLHGELPEGATATDLVLTVTELLREKGVVGKFVEFYGHGLSNLPLADRATIGNMSPEFGSTCAIFPIDEETLRYLLFSGRPQEQVDLVEAYAKEQGLWHDENSEDPTFSDTLELDLGDVVPSLAGPKRPQDRVALSVAHEEFREALTDYVSEEDEVAEEEDVALTFPASDPVVRPGARQRRRRPSRAARRPRPRGARRAAIAPRPGHARRRHGDRAGPRPRRHRRDHELHEHVEPERHARRRAPRPQRRREGPDVQAVGEDIPRARARRSSPSTTSARASPSRSRRSASTSSATAARPASATAARCRRRSPRRWRRRISRSSPSSAATATSRGASTPT